MRISGYGSHNSPRYGEPVFSSGLIIPLQESHNSPSRVSKFPFEGLKNPFQGSQKSPSCRPSGSQRRQSATKHQLLTAEPVAKLILDLRSFVETPMRVKDAPLTLRRKLRTSFALSYQLLRLISICGLAAVSMVFRANSGLAFSAKHIAHGPRRRHHVRQHDGRALRLVRRGGRRLHDQGRHRVPAPRGPWRSWGARARPG